MGSFFKRCDASGLCIKEGDEAVVLPLLPNTGYRGEALNTSMVPQVCLSTAPMPTMVVWTLNRALVSNTSEEGFMNLPPATLKTIKSTAWLRILSMTSSGTIPWVRR